ncbi:MAG: SpaH/EbpB family LPXTG-anchored major pilin [Coriobacteriia bacterium]|nr:SpaH/EbpB family LPXTG-anchored major pilin [Coriobacteriia bacterium]
MKKNKLLSFILAAAMVLTMVLPAGAQASDGASVTVNSTPGLVLSAGDFSAYKLFSVTVSKDADDKVSYVYTPVDALADFLIAYHSTYGDDLRAYLKDLGDNAAELDQLTQDLKAYNAIHHTFTAIPANVAASTGSAVKFIDLDYGYYLIDGNGKAKDGNDTVVSHCALTTVDEYTPHQDIYIKSDAPNIDKFVWNHNTGIKDWTNWTDVNIGDTVEFQLNSTVPDMTGYRTYQYIVYDNLDHGLSLDSGFKASDVKVSIGTGAGKHDFTDFTISVATTETTLLKITFGSTFIDEAKNQPIQITYSATLNEEALIAPDSNDNTVWLEYSNNPYIATKKGKTTRHIVHVYTYEIDLFKVDGSTETGLGGARFNLRTTKGDNDTNLKFKLVTPGSDTATSEYIVSKDGTATIETPGSGRVHLIGVDTGDYYLNETKAPTGYNPLDDEKEITVTSDVDENGGVSFVLKEQQVENFGGGVLPHTGGIGIVIFYALAALLTLGLVVFFIIRRKRNLLSVK